MDINHVMAEMTIRQLQDKYASGEWQRRAELGAAVRRTRRSAAPRRRGFSAGWTRLWIGVPAASGSTNSPSA
jgi:hypothetical protein